MKKKVLCIALALLLCIAVTVPTAFADSSADTPPTRAVVSATYGLQHVSGSTYKMWAAIINPSGVSVSATLALYDNSYNYITSVNTVSADTFIYLYKNVSLSSGTYHLRLNYTVNGKITSTERAYTI